MSDLFLPHLTPDNPENRLSRDARQRIARAYLEYNLIHKRAVNAVDLGDHWNTPREHALMRKAALKAIRVVLRVEAEEYAKLGLPAREFREIMRGIIESTIYSFSDLGFSHVQRDLFEAEFLWLDQVEQEEKPSTVTVLVPHTATLGQTVEAFRRENGLSQLALAAKMHAIAGAKVSVKTIQRIENGHRPGPQTLSLLAAVMERQPSELPEN